MTKRFFIISFAVISRKGTLGIQNLQITRKDGKIPEWPSLRFKLETSNPEIRKVSFIALTEFKNEQELNRFKDGEKKEEQGKK